MCPVYQLRQPEVAQVRGAGRIEQNIGRLDIPVQDTSLVGMFHCEGDPNEQLTGLFGCKPAFCHGFGQGPAGDQLHTHEELALVLAQIMNRHDVRMVQRGHSLRLQIETARQRARLTSSSADDLERHSAIGWQVSRVIDYPHRPRTQFTQ